MTTFEAPAEVLEPLVTVAEMIGLPGAEKLTQDRIDAAAADIRGACGWHIAPVLPATLVGSGRGGPKLVLPTLRPKLITSVRARDERTGELGPPLLRWRPIGGGMLYRREGWPVGVENIVATCEHGFDTCPADLRAAVLAMAESVGELAVGVRSDSRTTGMVTRSKTYFAEGMRAGSTGLPPALDAVLGRYRLPS